MIPSNSLVFLIDDDASVRKGVSRLLRSAGYNSEAFASAPDFLTREQHSGPACVIVDVRMPGINGMDLQNVLIQRRREEQLVFITGHGDISMCAQAMKAGAVDFLPKPFRGTELLRCVERALARSVAPSGGHVPAWARCPRRLKIARRAEAVIHSPSLCWASWRAAQTECPGTA